MTRHYTKGNNVIHVTDSGLQKVEYIWELFNGTLDKSRPVDAAHVGFQYRYPDNYVYIMQVKHIHVCHVLTSECFPFSHNSKYFKYVYF